MRTIAFCIFFTLSTSLFAAEERRDWNTINICHLAWGNSTGVDLYKNGFYLNALQTIFSHAGYTVKTYVLPWNRCYNYVKQEVMDVVAIAWLTKANTADMLEPSPMLSGYSVENYLITTNPEVPNSTPESLKGLRFGGPALGSLPNQFREDYLPHFSEVKFSSSQNHSVYMLLKERLDLIYAPIDMFLDIYNSLPESQQKPYKLLKPSFGKILTGPLLTKNSRYPERQKKLIDDFNRAYIELCRFGKLNVLLEKHRKLDGILSSQYHQYAPNLLTHCDIILTNKSAEKLSAEDILKASGHLIKD